MVGLAVVSAEDTLRITAGKQHKNFKLTELVNYRGERGRRGNKLPKGYQKVTAISVLPKE